jgi:hypothetical protein
MWATDDDRRFHLACAALGCGDVIEFPTRHSGYETIAATT